MGRVLSEGCDINISEKLGEGASAALTSGMGKPQLGKTMESRLVTQAAGSRHGIWT